VHGFSLDALARRDLANERNVEVVNGIDELLPALESPRVVWMMVPAGAATEENIQLLVNQLASGDIVVDGGNAHYHDSQRRGRLLAEKASVSLMPACPAASGVSGKATA
jgi:6-phosphogluconate dehydrogenase